jgi:hypothetical protein
MRIVLQVFFARMDYPDHRFLYHMHLCCSYDGTVSEKSKFEEFGARLRVSNEEEEEMKHIYYAYSEMIRNRPEGVGGTDWDIHP